MAFQGDQFVRDQNFTRDRDLGPPNSTISADKVDGEFDNVGAALSTLKALISSLTAKIAEGAGSAYDKVTSDARFVKVATALSDIGALAKAGDKTAGPITLGGKPGATKGTLTTGTATFDYADGNVQTITVNGPVTFDFANLPDAGGTLQVNLSILSGSITMAGTTWWELGGGEKTTDFTKTGLVLATGRPYRLIVEMVAGYRTGIFQ